MNLATLSLTFSVDQDEPMGILEAVLAIARRGGVSLNELSFTDPGNARASIRLQSDEAERLDLFLARLHNAIGVRDIIRTDERQTIHAYVA